MTKVTELIVGGDREEAVNNLIKAQQRMCSDWKTPVGVEIISEERLIQRGDGKWR